MINVSIISACQNIMAKAEAKGDEEMLVILHGASNDLVAADVKYHKNCHASYVSDHNLKYTGFLDNKASKDTYANAFTALANDIQAEMFAGRAFDMDTLLNMYKRYLNEKGSDGSAYTTQKLKIRLKNFFKENIVFRRPHGHRPELVYSSNISVQDIINNAFNAQNKNDEADLCNTKFPKDTDDERLIVYKAAKIFKADLSDCKSVDCKPLDVSEITSEKARESIPNNLYWFLRWVISSNVDSLDPELSPYKCHNEADERHVSGTRRNSQWKTWTY